MRRRNITSTTTTRGFGGRCRLRRRWRSLGVCLLLALAPERRLHSDQVIELLWPDRPPDSARNNLHQAIFAARRALKSIGAEGHRCLELRDDVLALCPEDPVKIDAIAFEDGPARPHNKAGLLALMLAVLLLLNLAGMIRWRKR